MRRKKQEWTPNPQVEATLDRVIRLSEIEAAGLFGEVAPEDCEQLSLRARILATAMMFFLYRLDPEDVRTLWFAEQGLATLGWRPRPPNWQPETAPFEGLLPPPPPAEWANDP